MGKPISLKAMPKKFKGTPAQERALSAYVKLERAASAAFAYARVGLEEEGLRSASLPSWKRCITWDRNAWATWLGAFLPAAETLRW